MNDLQEALKKAAAAGAQQQTLQQGLGSSGGPPQFWTLCCVTLSASGHESEQSSKLPRSTPDAPAAVLRQAACKTQPFQPLEQRTSFCSIFFSV